MKNKKIAVLLVCILMLTGCGTVKETKEIKEAPKEELDIHEISKDAIVTASFDVCERSEIFSTIEEQTEKSEVVVYGEVTDIEYKVGANGIIRTNFDVKILESLKGDYKTGEVIKVVKGQGFASLKDIIESYHNIEEEQQALREQYKQYSDEELEEVYEQQLEMGDLMVEKGQKSVYFLKKSTFYNKEQTYCCVSGPEGEYAEVSDDCFVQLDIIGTQAQESYILSTLLETEDVRYKEWSYTLSEIIAKMNQE